jgi:hypothetical protein
MKKSDVLPTPRPENGPMKFGSDWTGVFVRGDACFMYAQAIARASTGDEVQDMVLESLYRLFQGADERVVKDADVQHLQPFEECLFDVDDDDDDPMARAIGFLLTKYRARHTERCAANDGKSECTCGLSNFPSEDK